MRKHLIFLLLLLVLGLFAQAQTPPVKVYQEKDGVGYKIYGDNTGIIPYQVKLEFSGMKNLKTNPSRLPEYFVLKPEQSHHLLCSLEPIKQAASAFSFNTTVAPGDPSQKPDYDYPYRLPFPLSKRYTVEQGYMGNFSHQGLYALDFNLAKGDTLMAARAGKVFRVVQHFTKGGTSPSLVAQANYIAVYHEDGTIATYSHILANSSMVKEGQNVTAGQPIARCGFNGYATGPHLHFEVNKVVPMGEQSIPTKFDLPDGTRAQLQEGKTYGKPLPHQALVKELPYYPEKNNKQLSVMVEPLNGHQAVYIGNPLGEKKSGKLKMDLKNLKGDIHFPYDFEVPAHTKAFLFYLDPIDPLKSWEYKIYLQY